MQEANSETEGRKKERKATSRSKVGRCCYAQRYTFVFFASHALLGEEIKVVTDIVSKDTVQIKKLRLRTVAGTDRVCGTSHPKSHITLVTRSTRLVRASPPTRVHVLI